MSELIHTGIVTGPIQNVNGIRINHLSKSAISNDLKLTTLSILFGSPPGFEMGHIAEFTFKLIAYTD